MDNTIKFYANIKGRKYFISGKNEEGKWFYLWKNKSFNTDLYLDTQRFINGLEIEKTKLKRVNADNKETRALEFKTEEDEKQYCITKDDIEARKKRNSQSPFDYIDDIVTELMRYNTLSGGDLINNIIKNKVNFDELQPIDDDELDF